MVSSLVFPNYDPTGKITEMLLSQAGLLSSHFDHAYVSIPASTESAFPELIEELKKQPFFVVNSNPPPGTMSLHFQNACKSALSHVSPDHVLHLCNPDRVLFALKYFPSEFFADTANPVNLPVVFSRSEKAWSVCPDYYRPMENLVTQLGQILWKKSLDFCWCHMAITAGQLASVLPGKPGEGMVFTAQLILPLMDKIREYPVDWLSWEDPYIFDKDPAQLKQEYESTPDDRLKRMSYVIPILSCLRDFYQNNS